MWCAVTDQLSSKEQEETERRATAFPIVQDKKSALLLNGLLGAAIKAWAAASTSPSTQTALGREDYGYVPLCPELSTCCGKSAGKKKKTTTTKACWNSYFCLSAQAAMFIWCKRVSLALEVRCFSPALTFMHVWTQCQLQSITCHSYIKLLILSELVVFSVGLNSPALNFSYISQECFEHQAGSHPLCRTVHRWFSYVCLCFAVTFPAFERSVHFFPSCVRA